MDEPTKYTSGSFAELSASPIVRDNPNISITYRIISTLKVELTAYRSLDEIIAEEVKL